MQKYFQNYNKIYEIRITNFNSKFDNTRCILFILNILINYVFIELDNYL